MITELEKKEIDEKYFPSGLHYKVKTFDVYSYSNSKRFDEPFETLQEYEAIVRGLRHRNALYFFYFIKGMNETDFIIEINNQYLNYTLKNKDNAKHWLNLTYDLVLKGFSVAGKIESIDLRGAFIKWYNIILNDLQAEQNRPQQLKVLKPKKALFDFIHNIKDKEAFLQDLKNTFPTEIGKSIKGVIDILNKEKILIYGTKEFKQLFGEIENHFNRNIGSYNSVQNVKTVDKETTEIVLNKLNPLIIKYKTT